MQSCHSSLVRKIHLKTSSLGFHEYMTVPWTIMKIISVPAQSGYAVRAEHTVGATQSLFHVVNLMSATCGTTVKLFYTRCTAVHFRGDKCTIFLDRFVFRNGQSIIHLCLIIVNTVQLRRTLLLQEKVVVSGAKSIVLQCRQGGNVVEQSQQLKYFKFGIQ